MKKRRLYCQTVKRFLVFAVLPNSIDITEFLSQLNSLSHSINFTVEHENNGSIPFLDVLVMRNNFDRPQFKVYRKPTHSNMYLHSFSSHSISVKLGAINSIFIRAYKICDPQFLEAEIEFIFNTFLKLGYQRNFIEKSHQKARSIYYKCRDKPVNNFSHTIVLPCICNNNYVKSLFPPTVRLVYSNNNTVKSFLRNPITKCMTTDAGIYRVPCNRCNLVYIGESDNIPRRLQQHKNDVRNANDNNPIVKHIVNADHPVSIDQSTVIKNISNIKQRKLIESFLISNSNNMNIYSASIHFDSTTSILLKNNSPFLSKLLNIVDPG